MIVHVSSVYPPKLGGLEKVVQVLATEQAELGMQTRVITSTQDAAGSEIHDTIPVERLRSFEFANTIFMPGLLFALLRIPRDDIVHLHVARAYTPEIVWLASKIKRFRYVAHVHLDIPPSGPAGFLLKIYKPLVLRRALRGAAYVAVFTEEQRQNFHTTYGIPLEQLKAIPNGVERKFYLDEKRQLSKKPRLLFVGRLNYQKNLSQLLQALDGISDRFITTLVGNGEEEQSLKSLARKLKLRNVDFAGRADGEALLDHYKKADVFVLPSEREGMPLVLLEAMAMGLPIVATDVTGSRDVVVTGKNGLLAPYGDADAFRQALLDITANGKTYARYSRRSRELADGYSWTIVAQTFQKLYDTPS